MSPRAIVGTVAALAGLAALAARAVAASLSAIERELSTYRVEVPPVIPLRMDEEADL